MTPSSQYEINIESWNYFYFIDLNNATLHIAAYNDFIGRRRLYLNMSDTRW